MYHPGQQIPKVSPGEPFPKPSPLQQKQSSPLSGGVYTCFLAKLLVEKTEFVVRVDTGSSDTVIASQLVNNFTGTVLNYTFPGNQAAVRLTYGDTSFWTGFLQRLNCGVFNTNISAVCPIALMTTQSTSPLFLSEDDNISGLLGVGFPSLSSATLQSPRTVMDAWFNEGQIAKKQLAMHGCTYSREDQSFFDIGNDSPYQPKKTCANWSATIGIPSPTYFNLDILEISFGAVPVPLSFNWQTRSGGFKTYSILDSCTSLILLPSYIVEYLKNQVYNSGGLSPSILNSVYFQNWIDGIWSVSWDPKSFNWELLPTVSFTIKSQATNYQNVTLVLGPRQYIQVDKTGNFCKARC